MRRAAAPRVRAAWCRRASALRAWREAAQQCARRRSLVLRSASKAWQRVLSSLLSALRQRCLRLKPGGQRLSGIHAAQARPCGTPRHQRPAHRRVHIAALLTLLLRNTARDSFATLAHAAALHAAVARWAVHDTQHARCSSRARRSSGALCARAAARLRARACERIATCALCARAPARCCCAGRTSPLRQRCVVCTQPDVPRCRRRGAARVLVAVRVAALSWRTHARQRTRPPPLR
jgi:hypothetical protein